MTESPWTFGAESAALGGDRVTLVEGSTFCISDPSGAITPSGVAGLYDLDTRLLSTFELDVEGRPVEPLGLARREPFWATFVGRLPPAEGAATVLVVRDRYVGHGLREDVQVVNHSDEPRQLRVDLRIGTDFASVFAVKAGSVDVDDDRTRRLETTAEGLRAEMWSDDRRTVVVSADPPPDRCSTRGLTWTCHVPARGRWHLSVHVGLELGEVAVAHSHPPGERVHDTEPARRLEAWRAGVPRITSDHEGLTAAARRSLEDLAALRIFDPEDPGLPVIAAGAPWFMTLFGRDALLASWMALLVDPGLATGVLRALARHQGTRVDARTEEEPGRILHELRHHAAESLTLGGGGAYYGSVDATPLFVMLTGELARWGVDDELVAELLPHADRALEWIDHFGDRDGDGYVEYERSSASGLLHQGWKDSVDGLCFVDGTPAEPPIALAEVQGYVHAAWRARAHLAETAGDHDLAASCRERAATLRAAFNRDFWVPERGWYALGLDRDKRPIDALGSNVGHCLWTGIVDDDRSAAVADQLAGPELFSGWGLRTLATSMSAYDPVSYHRGSVWPHDTALAVAGLTRYGHLRAAHRLATGLLDLAAHLDGRLPELVCGFGRDELPAPVPYPSACSPQAWAAASPLLVLRHLLRLDPRMSSRELYLAPALPEGIGRVHVGGVPLGQVRLSIDAHGPDATASGLPDDVTLRHHPDPHHT